MAPELKYAHKFPTRKVGWSGYKIGCRCPGCVEGNRTHMAENRARKRARVGGTSLVTLTPARPVVQLTASHNDSPPTVMGVQRPEMSEDAYRQHCWQTLMQLATMATDQPGKMIGFLSDDGGKDIAQLHELMTDWVEADPANAHEFVYGLSDDDQKFSIWIPVESSEAERQQTAAQRQYRLIMGESA